ncbi:MAG: hypothetical protein JWM09_589 [Francisellaceae bacterium]|nr:hypothetical protein [Francisellaceae bacterium]
MPKYLLVNKADQKVYSWPKRIDFTLSACLRILNNDLSLVQDIKLNFELPTLIQAIYYVNWQFLNKLLCHKTYDIFLEHLLLLLEVSPHHQRDLGQAAIIVVKHINLEKVYKVRVQLSKDNFPVINLRRN